MEYLVPKVSKSWSLTDGFRTTCILTTCDSFSLTILYQFKKQYFIKWNSLSKFLNSSSYLELSILSDKNLYLGMVTSGWILFNRGSGLYVNVNLVTSSGMNASCQTILTGCSVSNGNSSPSGCVTHTVLDLTL